MTFFSTKFILDLHNSRLRKRTLFFGGIQRRTSLHTINPSAQKAVDDRAS